MSGLLPLSLEVVGTGISHIEAGGPLAVACLVVPAVPVANVGIPHYGRRDVWCAWVVFCPCWNLCERWIRCSLEYSMYNL